MRTLNYYYITKYATKGFIPVIQGWEDDYCSNGKNIYVYTTDDGLPERNWPIEEAFKEKCEALDDANVRIKAEMLRLIKKRRKLIQLDLCVEDAMQKDLIAEGGESSNVFNIFPRR